MSYNFRINCLKFSSVAIFLLFLQTATAQVNKRQPKELGTEQFSSLDALVLHNQKGLGNNLVAMVWTDTLVYKRELGEFDSRTLSPLASASAWLTTALVLKMAEEGKISLDDKVSQYIPLYESYGKTYITIRHCLSNYTGIQSESGGLLGKKKFNSLEEEVESFAKKEIKSNPGTEFSFSHIGINIAGRILEIVSKKKFDMLIKQKLFNPMGMRKTTFSTLDGSAINPFSGAQSTAEEYMKFLKMLLNKGNYNGQQILSMESINELRRMQTKPGEIKYSPKSTEGFGYALGSWVIDEGNDGIADALFASGIPGPWPVVDWCRGYAFLLILKNVPGEQKKEIFLQMKDAVDERMKGKCD